jgi:hypothetical protein
MDTLSGLNQVWLSPRSARESLEVTQRAIDLLIDRGLLVVHQLPDGTTAYRCAEPDACQRARGA